MTKQGWSSLLVEAVLLRLLVLLGRALPATLVRARRHLEGLALGVIELLLLLRLHHEVGRRLERDLHAWLLLLVLSRGLLVELGRLRGLRLRGPLRALLPVQRVRHFLPDWRRT